MLRIGVTGTDTGVGKTVIAVALAGLFCARGVRTAVMKPVETGVTRGDSGSDHVLLATAANMSVDNPDICPVILDEPLAPWVASKLSQVEIDVADLDGAFERLCAGSECVIVEGAGGLLVPITRSLRFDSLFARWKLDLVVVAADRLGALNHSLLTVEAAQRAGLRVRGIVLNQLHRTNRTNEQSHNAGALRELVPEIPVIEFPCVDGMHGLRQLRDRSVPIDASLLRDIALSTGLMKIVE